MTQVASLVCDYDIFTVEVTKNYTQEAWYESLKELMIMAGADNKNMVFMMIDNQIGDRTYIFEDLNNLLNISDIPNLFI